MIHRGRSTELATLRSRWRRWTAIVNLFACRRRGRNRVNPQAYRTLHQELTEHCRSLADSADESERVFCRMLEDLVQPWLSPGVLAKADREILDDLLIRCRQAERELGERTQDPAARLRCALVIMVSAVVTGSFVLVRGVEPGWSPVLGHMQGWSDLIESTLSSLNGKTLLFILSLVVIPASLVIPSRIKRS